MLTEVVRGRCESLSPRRALLHGQAVSQQAFQLFIFVQKEPKRAQVVAPSLTPWYR